MTRNEIAVPNSIGLFAADSDTPATKTMANFQTFEISFSKLSSKHRPQ
jgi:hypothetical protein